MYTNLTHFDVTDAWLQARDLSLEEPQVIYRELSAILKEAPINRPYYWQNHGLVFEEGQIHIVDHRGDDARVSKLVKDALWAPDLSFQEKAELAIHAKSLFAAHNLQLEEPTITLSLIEDSGAHMSTTISLSECSNSLFLIKFWTTDYSDTIYSQAGKEITVHLPLGITHKDFLNYANPNTLNRLNSNELFSLLILSDYFQDLKLGNLCLDHILLPESRTDLENLLIQNPISESELTNRYASLIMNKYIQLRLREGDSIQSIVQTFQRVPELREAISNSSFDLCLTGLISSPDELTLLASAIPNVHSLTLTHSQLDQLPLVWKDTLEQLDISEAKNIATIPNGFSCLRRFEASWSRNLQDISGLNGSKSLEMIDISNTLVISAPRDCRALKIFNAQYAVELNDISGLDGSRFLQKIDITGTAVISAPYDCKALQIFIASESIDLNDISGLNGSLTLKEVDIQRTSVSSAPHSCPSLKIFNAFCATNLTNISGLSSSSNLQKIDIRGTIVNIIPESIHAQKILI